MPISSLLFFQSNQGSGWTFVICGAPIAFIIIMIIYSFAVNNNANEQARRMREEKLSKMSPEEREQYIKEESERKQGIKRSETYGTTSPEMICPHCQTKGKVRTKQITEKKGISGSKATGAVLTGGASVLATGLSRKENLTQAYCENCKNTWKF